MRPHSSAARAVSLGKDEGGIWRLKAPLAVPPSGSRGFLATRLKRPVDAQGVSRQTLVIAGQK
jgi:hypothetical protein